VTGDDGAAIASATQEKIAELEKKGEKVITLHNIQGGVLIVTERAPKRETRAPRRTETR
jgi:hypothetical protein